MKSAEIRETYLTFFEQHGHKRLPSASLVPAGFDPTVLLTTAGMQPLKPYFLGQEKPPSKRLASCQKCFRTTDIDQVGLTARHLTFFEMLGNFSIGDYFKREAVEFGWQLSTEGFGFDPAQIWVTVFKGDDELGLEADEEAVECWRSVGVADERIVYLPRKENFWQAGSVGPCGPCSELYLDRGPSFGGDELRPGDDTDRFLEYWNLVFMQYELDTEGKLEDLPSRSIDTGLGLDRMAAILQGVPSVFENDLLSPLVQLGEELSSSKYGQDKQTTRALRILADHGRALTFLAADGVVPSNEDRGYILRRVMRRAIQQGGVLGIEPPFLAKFAQCTIELFGSVYPELPSQAETVLKWANAEEEGFLRTLEQGNQMLTELIEQAKDMGTSWVPAEDAFKLHDTYGFPYDLTREILAVHGLSVDDEGFEELMEEQRRRARMGTATAHGSEKMHGKVAQFIKSTGPASGFVGYEKLDVRTVIGAIERVDGRLLAKLAESPFYAEGGGQVADSGVVETGSGRAVVKDVYRVGDDQVLELDLERGELGPKERALARVDGFARHATACNHTGTHLLNAALRNRLGEHVRQAGSAVRPDKLRFDFTHSMALSDEDVEAIEDQVNRWIVESHPVRALHMSRAEAEKLGAMALFGEKYGEWVRVVEVESLSRELCGGTHVSSTSEIGSFKIVSESSSAANVRRIEAISGPEAIGYFRKRDREIAQIASVLKKRPDEALVGVLKLGKMAEELQAKVEQAGAGEAMQEVEDLIRSATDHDGVKVVGSKVEGAGPERLRDLCDHIGAKLGESAVVLGAPRDGGLFLTVKLSKGVVSRGLKANEIVNSALQCAGGKGGGRPALAQGGGRDGSKLDQAIEMAVSEIEEGLAGR